MNGDRRISAEREERSRAEIYVTAIAAEDVPAGREHDILQHDVAGEEVVVVAERKRGGVDDTADDKAH